MGESTYNELLNKLAELQKQKDECDRKIAAVKELLPLYAPDSHAAVVEEDSVKKRDKTGKKAILSYGELATWLKTAIDQQEGSFSVADLAEHLQRRGHAVSNNSIQSAVKRLLNRRYIRVVRHGKGRNPSRYRVA